MGWMSWRAKSSKLQEKQVNSVTTRIQSTKPWEDTPIAPSNENFRLTKRGKKSKKERKSYYDTYKNTQFKDEDYYNETAFPTHGQVANRNHQGGNIVWSNGRVVKDHKDTKIAPVTTGYIKPVVQKAYAYTADRWNSYSFGGWDYFGSAKSKDDDSRLFISSPEGYLTPTASEIQTKILVYETHHTDTVKNLSRLFYHKMTEETDYIIPNIIDTIGTDKFNSESAFYAEAYEKYVPGYTPMEQAINYYQAILDAKKRKGTGEGSGTDRIEFKREDFNNPHLNEQMRWNKISAKTPIQVLNKVSLIGQLGYQFHVEKEIGERETANSVTYRPKPMRSYSQLERVSPYQKVLPNYRYKLLTRSLQINVPVESSEKKQKIIILTDYSGSMASNKKQMWVNAILADRFRYVMMGEAEVYFSFFVDQPSQMKFTHVKNAKDVEEFWKTFSNEPTGGNTDIGRIVQYVADEVKGGKSLHNLSINLSHEQPEILIINDGQDSVNVKKFPYKVNAISLMQFSDQLKDLCVATGGKQVQVDEDESITTHSSDGSAILQT